MSESYLATKILITFHDYARKFSMNSRKQNTSLCFILCVKCLVLCFYNKENTLYYQNLFAIESDFKDNELRIRMKGAFFQRLLKHQSILSCKKQSVMVYLSLLYR